VSVLRGFARPKLWLGLWIFGWALCIGLSMLPQPPVPIDVPDSDKFWHFLAYALLAAWAAWIFETPRARKLAMLSLCLLGVAIEVMQGTLTSHRTMDWHDALADFLGVGVGWWLGLRSPGLLQRIDKKIGQR